MLINDDGLRPCHGQLVICDMCGITYKFFVWALGAEAHLCRKCVHKRPAAYLDNIDAIDSEAEQAIIDDEMQELHDRDFPPHRRACSSRKVKPMTGSEYRKIQRRQDKSTITKFKKKGAVDVGLG